MKKHKGTLDVDVEIYAEAPKGIQLREICCICIAAMKNVSEVMLAGHARSVAMEIHLR